MKIINWIALHITPSTTDVFCEVDPDTIPWKDVNFITEAVSDDHHIFHIILYHNHYYAFDTYDPFALAPGDFEEWAAASCGES